MPHEKIFVIPALEADKGHSFDAALQGLRQQGIEYNLATADLVVPDITQYHFRTASAIREHMKKSVQAARSVIEQCAGLLVVNDAPEWVGGSRIPDEKYPKVLNSVGGVALGIMEAAKEIYGSNRRIFLSHEYPSAKALAGYDTSDIGIQYARSRIARLERVRPITVRDNWHRVRRSLKEWQK